MQKYIFVLGLLVLLSLWGFAEPASSETEKPMVVDNPHPVLLELFTSQGCSSCPPADRVLQKLDKETQSGELTVIALSYHVDYWNRLGWTDPYSSADFSQRQRNYASKINDQGVYTPQLIVQGKSGHIGSREREVRSVINEASRTKHQVSITASLVQEEETMLNYKLTGMATDVILNIALAEKDLENAVPRGENRGRQLSHTNVVRRLITIKKPEASGNLIIPKEVFSQAENGKIILFVQEQENWEVLGVVALDLEMR